MKEWTNGMGFIGKKKITVIFVKIISQHSNIPILQHSNTPVLQYSA
jgi:hypothetical protein